MKIEITVAIPVDLHSELIRISETTEIKRDDLITDLLRLALLDKRCGPWIKGRLDYLNRITVKKEVKRVPSSDSEPSPVSPGLVIDIPETKPPFAPPCGATVGQGGGK